MSCAALHPNARHACREATVRVAEFWSRMSRFSISVQKEVLPSQGRSHLRIVNAGVGISGTHGRMLVQCALQGTSKTTQDLACAKVARSKAFRKRVPFPCRSAIARLAPLTLNPVTFSTAWTCFCLEMLSAIVVLHELKQRCTPSLVLSFHLVVPWRWSMRTCLVTWT